MHQDGEVDAKCVTEPCLSFLFLVPGDVIWWQRSQDEAATLYSLVILFCISMPFKIRLLFEAPCSPVREIPQKQPAHGILRQPQPARSRNWQADDIKGPFWAAGPKAACMTAPHLQWPTRQAGISVGVLAKMVQGGASTERSIRNGVGGDRRRGGGE